MKFAERLAAWSLTSAAVAGGSVNLDQAQVIVAALDLLPTDLVGAEVLDQCEAHLVEQAAHFTPKELRALGERLLEVLAPDKYDEAERRRIEAALARARKRTRLNFHRNGDGTTRISGTLPDAIADRLRTYLDAFASPRRNNPTNDPGADPARNDSDPDPESPARIGVIDPATGEYLPADVIRGHAFAALLEHLDPARLPQHGGAATQVLVNIDHDKLRDDLGSAMLLSGTALSVGETRRLACDNAILPAVLNGTSEVLDLGRSRRLFSPAQRKAMALRDRHCRAEGCTVPAAWCEAHHANPWANGGNTDLNDGLLVCSWHHHRAHDPTYDTTRMPNGDLRYHRRT